MWTLILLLGTALAKSPTLYAGEHAMLFTLPVVNETSKATGGDAGLTQVSLGDYTGVDPVSPRKAVVVYFFTKSTAGSDLEALDRVQKKFEGKGLQVLAICTDAESTGTMAGWLSGMKLGFPVLTDQYGIVRARYGVDQTPVTYIVDAEGYLHSAGNPHGDALEAEIEAQVASLL